MSAQTRFCPGCERDLPLSEFYTSPGNTNCKACIKAYNAAYYRKRTAATPRSRAIGTRVSELEDTVAELQRTIAGLLNSAA